MIRVATLALAAASLFSSLAQAQVVNQVQADFGVISPLPYSREFGTTFVRDAVGGYLTTATSRGTTTTGSIDGSVVSRPLVSQPGSANFNFYDDLLFTMPATDGSLTASAVSVSFLNVLGIDNLQARLYRVGSDGLSTGAVSGGATYAWASTTPLGGSTLSLTTFGAPVALLAGATYALEVRGLVYGPTASYGGNVNVSAVPESGSLSLALAGLLVAGGVGRRLSARRAG